MISVINSNPSRINIIVDSLTLPWMFLMFWIMLIVGSILSLIRDLSSSRISMFSCSIISRLIKIAFRIILHVILFIIWMEMDKVTLLWSLGVLSITWWIVEFLISTLFRRLISSVQKLINQEKTVTKVLANVLALCLCFAGFQESSKDSSVAHYLIVMFTVVMARVWVSFLMSLMFNNESVSWAPCSRRQSHEGLVRLFRPVRLHKSGCQSVASALEPDSKELEIFSSSSSFKSDRQPVESDLETDSQELEIIHDACSHKSGRQSVKSKELQAVTTVCPLRADCTVQHVFDVAKIVKFWHTPVLTFSWKHHFLHTIIKNIETTRLLPLMWIPPKPPTTDSNLRLKDENLSKQETRTAMDMSMHGDSELAFEEMILVVEELEENEETGQEDSKDQGLPPLQPSNNKRRRRCVEKSNNCCERQKEAELSLPPPMVLDDLFEERIHNPVEESKEKEETGQEQDSKQDQGITFQSDKRGCIKKSNNCCEQERQENAELATLPPANKHKQPEEDQGTMNVPSSRGKRRCLEKSNKEEDQFLAGTKRKRLAPEDQGIMNDPPRSKRRCVEKSEKEENQFLAGTKRKRLAPEEQGIRNAPPRSKRRCLEKPDKCCERRQEGVDVVALPPPSSSATNCQNNQTDADDALQTLVSVPRHRSSRSPPLPTIHENKKSDVDHVRTLVSVQRRRSSRFPPLPTVHEVCLDEMEDEIANKHNKQKSNKEEDGNANNQKRQAKDQHGFMNPPPSKRRCIEKSNNKCFERRQEDIEHAPPLPFPSTSSPGRTMEQQEVFSWSVFFESLDEEEDELASDKKHKRPREDQGIMNGRPSKRRHIEKSNECCCERKQEDVEIPPPPPSPTPLELEENETEAIHAPSVPDPSLGVFRSENNKDTPGVAPDTPQKVQRSSPGLQAHSKNKKDTPQKVLRRSLRLMAKAAKKKKLPHNIPQQSHRVQTNTQQDEIENKNLRRSLRIAKKTGIIFLQLP